MKHPVSRNTLYQEQGKLIEKRALAGNQYYMRLYVPLIAQQAKPGNFVHIQCNIQLPMRRPMSIMRADKNDGWIDILYKICGHGTKQLSQCDSGQTINLIGPMGNPFETEVYKKYPLLIGGGIGIPPLIFLTEHIKKNSNGTIQPLIIMGSEIPFPFTPKPSQIMLNGIPDDVIASMPLLEDWGIASRLASLQGYNGCYEGYVTELARHWLNYFDDQTRQQVQIFSCGPTSMLKAVARLAYQYQLDCQVSLEEYMACAVGGCAGCTVLVTDQQGQSMKRVCVDGPVFEAATIFPQ